VIPFIENEVWKFRNDRTPEECSVMNGSNISAYETAAAPESGLIHSHIYTKKQLKCRFQESFSTGGKIRHSRMFRPEPQRVLPDSLRNEYKKIKNHRQKNVQICNSGRII
jgi:hypothetical protein